MQAASDGVPGRLPSVAPLLTSKWGLPVAFVTACVTAGYITVRLYEIGGLDLVTCAIVSLLFVVIGLADMRYAFILAFAFSLFQPVVTRLIFCTDFANAAPESMVGHKDLLTTTASLLLLCSAGLALLPMLTGHPSPIPRSLRHLIGFYVAINLVQVLNPNKTLLAGVYGFKNNVLPVLMIFVGCSVVRSRDAFVRFVTFIALFSAVALVYGLYQEISGLPAFESYWYSRTVPPTASMFLTLGRTVEIRIPSVFQGYTSYSYVITAFGIVIYALGSSLSRGIWRYLRTVCLGLLGLYFVFSMERMAIAMFIIGVLCFHFVTSSSKKRVFRFAIVGGVAVLALLVLVNKTSQRLRDKGWATESTKLIRLAEMARPFEASSVVAGRIRNRWSHSVEIIKKHPLTGTGAGSGTFTRGHKEHDQWILPHNEFLQKQIELGLAGAVVFVAILCVATRSFFQRCAERTQERYLRGYTAGMVGVLAAYTGCGMFNVPFLYESGIVFWFLAGLVFRSDPVRGAST